jgi:predicted HD phosphohydrolase
MSNDMNADQVIEEILNAYATCGHLDYGEHISMQEHMLQAAHLAERNGESDTVVVATLLHDYGHLICNMPNNTFEDGMDNFHEQLGAKSLENWFGKEIIGAIALHVDAKRYLCSASPGYRNKLSQASITTLAVQGGPMNEQEMTWFREQKGHQMALKVRIYDDQGKDPHMERPGLDHYIPMLRKCMTF